MIISRKEIVAIYSESKAVYEKKKNKDNALDILEKLPMNRGSAIAYINNFESLLNGRKYTRTMNETATDYYLSQILSDFGKDSLRKALNAVDKHIMYYESLNHGRLNGIRKIYNVYSLLLKKE